MSAAMDVMALAAALSRELGDAGAKAPLCRAEKTGAQASAAVPAVHVPTDVDMSLTKRLLDHYISCQKYRRDLCVKAAHIENAKPGLSWEAVLSRMRPLGELTQAAEQRANDRLAEASAALTWLQDQLPSVAGKRPPPGPSDAAAWASTATGPPQGGVGEAQARVCVYSGLDDRSGLMVLRMSPDAHEEAEGREDGRTLAQKIQDFTDELMKLEQAQKAAEGAAGKEAEVNDLQEAVQNLAKDLLLDDELLNTGSEQGAAMEALRESGDYLFKLYQAWSAQWELKVARGVVLEGVRLLICRATRGYDDSKGVGDPHMRDRQDRDSQPITGEAEDLRGSTRDEASNADETESMTEERIKELRERHPGSRLHPRDCRPCHFQSGQCWKDMNCSFCHLCPKPKRKSKHQRDVDKRRQERYKDVRAQQGDDCLDGLTQIDEMRRQMMAASEEHKRVLKEGYSADNKEIIAKAKKAIDDLRLAMEVYVECMPAIPPPPPPQQPPQREDVAPTTTAVQPAGSSLETHESSGKSCPTVLSADAQPFKPAAGQAESPAPQMPWTSPKDMAAWGAPLVQATSPARGRGNQNLCLSEHQHELQ